MCTACANSIGSPYTGHPLPTRESKSKDPMCPFCRGWLGIFTAIRNVRLLFPCLCVWRPVPVDVIEIMYLATCCLYTFYVPLSSVSLHILKRLIYNHERSIRNRNVFTLPEMAMKRKFTVLTLCHWNWDLIFDNGRLPTSSIMMRFGMRGYGSNRIERATIKKRSILFLNLLLNHSVGDGSIYMEPEKFIFWRDIFCLAIVDHWRK